MKTIETIENWNILSAALKEKGYRLWQMQYGAELSEGFHVWFWREGKNDVEVCTHSEEVQQAIIEYNHKPG
jgi:hypothetical protein